MKALIITLSLLSVLSLCAQPEKVTKSVTVNGQDLLDLNFAFANDITFKVWNKSEVFVEVMVEINGGEDNEIFTLHETKSASTIAIAMDEDMWEKLSGSENAKGYTCCNQSSIDYTVYLPAGLKIKANTISGNYDLEYFGESIELKTISGEIDLTIPLQAGLTFDAKTITGEVYANVAIEYPEGKEGLKQIVGQNFRGKINGGNTHSSFETISGNIYLREGR